MDFSKLTDAELRVELKRRGFPVGPITATTRSVHVKKLQQHAAEHKVANGEKSGQENGVANDGPMPMDYCYEDEDSLSDCEEQQTNASVVARGAGPRTPTASPPPLHGANKMTAAGIVRLSDAELRRELVARGQKVGPVTATTRSVYEKKLVGLLGK